MNDRRRWCVVMPLVAVTTAGLMAATRSESAAASCGSVGEWVVQHRAELPTTYEEIIKYPVTYRKRMLGLMSASERRALWGRQFEIYLVSGMLSPAEAKFVARAAIVVRDELYADSSSLAHRTAVATKLTDEAVAVLGRDLTHRVLFVLGPDDAPGANASVQPAVFRYAMLNRARVPSPELTCDCHIIDGGGTSSPPDCNSPKMCDHDECTPISIQAGCGAGGNFACNGTCW